MTCPICGLGSIGVDRGSLVCANGHRWPDPNKAPVEGQVSSEQPIRGPSQQNKDPAPLGSSPGWPGWICVNCGKEYPNTTRTVRCPGQGKPCGGYLIRWVRYERKSKEVQV